MLLFKSLLQLEFLFQARFKGVSVSRTECFKVPIEIQIEINSDTSQKQF